MSLSFHLKIVGTSLLLLAVAHAFFPRRFNWGEELHRLSPLNRQIFQVHCFFIGLVLSMFGSLALCFTSTLIERTALARIVLSGLMLFWVARLIVQLFVYQSSLWKGNRFNTRIHWLFSTLWIYYVAVFGWALWNQVHHPTGDNSSSRGIPGRPAAAPPKWRAVARVRGDAVDGTGSRKERG